MTASTKLEEMRCTLFAVVATVAYVTSVAFAVRIACQRAVVTVTGLARIGQCGRIIPISADAT